MFAHGLDDCRKPVFDISETESGSSGSTVGVANGEKYVDQFEDRTSLLDPKWNGIVNITLIVYILVIVFVVLHRVNVEEETQFIAKRSDIFMLSSNLMLTKI